MHGISQHNGAVLLACPPMYIKLLLRYGAQLHTILNASFAHAAATIAFVEAMAGMMFLITPCVCMRVTPAM